jgi:uncharacterized membrane protein
MKRRLSFAERLASTQRLLFAVGAAVCACAAQSVLWGGASSLLVSWDVGAAVYLALAWLVIVRSDAKETRLHARAQDVAAYLIFVTVLVAAFASVAAITLLLGDVKELEPWPKAAHVFMSAFALLSSWLLIHTLYSFHYARRFYTSAPDTDEERHGLDFPGDGNPDYFDFAYYSFVVGMTSQVSDVDVTGRHMRRVTLMHSVLSFVFNVAVLALSVNIIVNVIGS